MLFLVLFKTSPLRPSATPQNSHSQTTVLSADSAPLHRFCDESPSLQPQPPYILSFYPPQQTETLKVPPSPANRPSAGAAGFSTWLETTKISNSILFFLMPPSPPAFPAKCWDRWVVRQGRNVVRESGDVYEKHRTRQESTGAWLPMDNGGICLQTSQSLLTWRHTSTGAVTYKNVIGVQWWRVWVYKAPSHISSLWISRTKLWRTHGHLKDEETNSERLDCGPNHIFHKQES